jgi:hypothetical protein
VLLLREDFVEGKDEGKTRSLRLQTQARVRVEGELRWGEGKKKSKDLKMSVVLDMMGLGASCQWEPKQNHLDGLG